MVGDDRTCGCDMAREKKNISLDCARGPWPWQQNSTLPSPSHVPSHSATIFTCPIRARARSNNGQGVMSPGPVPWLHDYIYILSPLTWLVGGHPHPHRLSSSLNYHAFFLVRPRSMSLSSLQLQEPAVDVHHPLPPTDEVRSPPVPTFAFSSASVVPPSDAQLACMHAPPYLSSLLLPTTCQEAQQYNASRWRSSECTSCHRTPPNAWSPSIIHWWCSLAI